LVEVKETKIVVQQYDDFVLSCSGKSITPMTIKWIKSGSVLVQQKAEGNVNLDLEYKVPSAALEDDGKYVCEVTNFKGKTDVISAISIVARAPPPPIVYIPKAIQVLENENIEIQCLIKYPCEKTYWVFEPTNVTINGNADNTLVVEKAHRTSAGKYSCIAVRGDVSGEASTHVTVQYPATLLGPSVECK
jgi:Immunoglobulin domain